MTSSRAYIYLKKEIERLRWSLLPRVWHVTGDYSNSQRDKTRAFQVLVHAEIEFFIEKSIIFLVENRLNDFKKSGKMNYVTSCIQIAGKFGWQDEEGKEQNHDPVIICNHNKNKEAINTILCESVALYKKQIESNNGIKSENLKKMFYPIGISLDSFDINWVNQMSSFGEKRGKTAHTSRKGLGILPDPKESYEISLSLLEGLSTLDLMLINLRKK